MAYVAAFRAYYWNDDVAELARRFFAACPDGRQVVVADETRAKLPIDQYEVIAHTDDLSAFGLPDYPEGRSLWYNNDYALYVLRRALPGYDYYVTAESDVAVNVEIEPILAAAAARGIDIIGHELRQPGPDWHWYGNGKAVFAELWAGLFVFTLASARAVDLLLETRQRQAEVFKAGALAEWPFCESFIPSVLKRAGMNFAHIHEFVDTRNLSYRPHIQITDERANRPGTMVHSVLGRKDFIAAVVKEQPPADWFTPGSTLRRAMEGIPVAEFGPALLQRFADKVDHAGHGAFRQELLAQDVAVATPGDLAWCKPAIQSTICEWSRSTDPRIEAAGAVGVVAHEDYGFHTMFETNPWWAVDLLESYVIDELRILNRPVFSERFRTFVVQSSLDGATWITRFLKMDLAEVSADPARPHRILFADPPLARHLRIMMLGKGFFHLRRISVFGRAVMPAGQPTGVSNSAS